MVECVQVTKLLGAKEGLWNSLGGGRLSFCRKDPTLEIGNVIELELPQSFVAGGRSWKRVALDVLQSSLLALFQFFVVVAVGLGGSVAEGFDDVAPTVGIICAGPETGFVLLGFVVVGFHSWPLDVEEEDGVESTIGGRTGVGHRTSQHCH